MTPQEAINALKQINLKRVHPFYDWEEMLEVRDIAINALEKQIPKKPIPTEEQDIRYAMNYTCPSCGKHFTGTGIANYCYHCGQALDWSDTNA